VFFVRNINIDIELTLCQRQKIVLL